MMRPLTNAASLWYFLPESALVIAFLLIFILDLPKSLSASRRVGPTVATLGLLSFFALTLWGMDFPKALTFEGMAVVDPYTNFFRLFSAAAALMTVYLSLKSFELKEAG